ncbi:MAG: Ig-like domain-containing protein [Bacteroides sp.]
MRFKNWSFGLLLIMLAWLLPSSVWAEEWLIKLTYEPTGSDAYRPRLSFNYGAEVYGSEDGQSFRKISTLQILHFSGKKTYYIKGNFTEFTHYYDLPSNDAKVSAVLQNCTQLKKLEFKDSHHPEKIEIKDAPLLEKLILYPRYKYYAELKATNCPKLQKIAERLMVFKSLELTNTGIEMLGEMGELVTLKVNNCSDLTSIDATQSSKLTTFEAKGCEKLETVKVKSANLTTLDLTHSKVAVLDISDCSNISEIKGFAALPLQTLQAKNCGKLETLGVHSANLTTLDLTGCKISSLDVNLCAKLTSITGFDALPLRSLTAYNSGLTQITGQASLETLNASSCSDLTRIDAKQCSKLKTLEAKNCGKLATVEARSANLTTLDLTYSKVAVLDISNCTKISEIKGIAELSLETLRANNCSNLTKIESSKLETLEAKNCEKLATVAVKSAQLTTLDLTSSKVSSLDISSCAKLTSITGFDTLLLRTLTANNSGLTQITGKASLETLYANSCSKLTSIDAKQCRNLTTLEAKNCGKLATVEVESKELTKLDLSSSAITTLDVSACTKLTTIEVPKQNVKTLKCNACPSLSAETIKSLLNGNVIEVCEAQGVTLPAQLSVSKSLKTLDLYQAKGLTSFTVVAQSALEELKLFGIANLNDLDVLQAKKLKKLAFGNTAVKRISLKGLDELVYVGMPSNYPARLLNELICQLRDRKNIPTGELKYGFADSDKALVNGKEAKARNWKLVNAYDNKDVTDECTATATCNDIVLPSSPDQVYLELAADTKVKLTLAKPTMLWYSKTNNISDFNKNEYFEAGDKEISVTDKVYLFTQPNALSAIKIESASNVKNIALTRVPDLKELTLKEAEKLQSLDIKKQPKLTKLLVTKAEKLTSIDLSQNTKLTHIEVDECGLTGSLDFSSHNALTYLELFKNKLTDVKLGKAITRLQVSYNQLVTLDLTPAAGLERLYAYKNKLSEIKLADDKSKYVYFDIESNSLVALDLGNAINLTHLLIHSNPNLASLNLRGCVKLGELQIFGCKAFKEIQKPSETTWFLDGCKALRKLYVYKTGLNATELTKLYCKLPTISGDAEVRVVDKSDSDNLAEAKKSGTKIAQDKGWKVLDSDKNPFEGDKNRTCDDLKPHDEPVIELVVDAGTTKVKFTASAKNIWIEGSANNFEYVEVEAGKETTHTFETLVARTYKLHGKITSLDITAQDKVQGLKILKHDVLTELKASDCTGMLSVQLSDIANLVKLEINNSHVKELALATFPALKELSCAKNELTQLNFASNTKLEKVDCSDNASLKTITALKSVGSAPAPLMELRCGGSGLTIEAFNQLFCLLPDRTAEAKGKLYAVKDADEATKKLVPSNCYTSRATKKYWEIFLNNGEKASLGDEESGNHACESVKVKTIKIDPVEIVHHGTTLLQPSIEPAYADDPTVTWTLKAGADKVKLYDGGLIEALAVGTATLKCVANDGGGAETEVTVTVLEKQVKTITIKPSIASPFQIGDQVQFTATIEPTDATYRDITWSVDGEAATIDATTGLLLAKTATTSLIVTAKNNSPKHQKTQTYKVQINAPVVNDLILSQKELVIKKDGKKYPVAVTLDPPTAHIRGKIKLTLSAPNVSATCKPEYDENGFIRQPFTVEVEGIVENSETTVTISPEAVPTAKADLKVKVVTDFVEPTEIKMDETLAATVGTPIKINAEVLPATASNRTILWSLKDEESKKVLRIDVDGTITPLKGGRAIVVATAAGKTDLKKQCTVDVSVDAIPSEAKLMTTLTVAPNQDVQLQLAGAGDTYIKAADKVYQYTIAEAYYPVKVKSASDKIEIYGSLTKLEAKDAAEKITAITFTNDARLTELNVSGNSISELDLKALVDLEVLNCAKNKLTVLNLLRLTNLKELRCGQNQIAELALDANAKLEKLSCEELQLHTLNLATNGGLKELVCYGNKFATTVYDEIYCNLSNVGGVMIAAKAKVTGDPNYDALLASSSQLATKKGWKVLHEDKSDIQTTGTKTACESKPATGITIEPLSVKPGETKPIKYVLQPAGSTSVVTFRSMDDKVAKVDDKGNVTGVKAGTVDILVTTDVSTVNGICKVTVEGEKLELTGITIEPLSVEVGKTNKIKYKLQPEGVTATVSFKSKDESIAKVDAEGNVTGVKEGKVKIEVTTDVDNVKGECDVTVEKPSDVQDAFFASVRVMPNPFDTHIRVVLNGEMREMTYDIINVVGNVVSTGRILSNETQIETAELQAGIYLLRLTTDKGLVSSYRLIKK